MFFRHWTLAQPILFLAGMLDVLGIAVGKSVGSGFVWNVSVLIFGSLVTLGGSLCYKSLNSKVFSILLIIGGIGAIGAALFCGCNGLLLSLVKDKPLLYYPFAVTQYLALGICGIVSYKLTKPPFNYLCIFLGLLSLVIFSVWISSFRISYSGTTMPSILVDYSQSLWLVGFSSFLMGKKAENISSKNNKQTNREIKSNTQ